MTLQHEFVNGANTRTLPDVSGKQYVGNYQDASAPDGGFLSASCEIAPAEYAAFPLVYVQGCSWFVKDTESNEYIFAGELREPEPGPGTVQMSADGWGTRADQTNRRMLFETQNLDIWTSGQDAPVTYHSDINKISAEIKGSRMVFRVQGHTSFRKNGANSPTDWKTGMYAWFPLVNIRRIQFGIAKTVNDNAYTLELVKASGPNGALTVVASWSLGSGGPSSVDQAISGTSDLIGLRVVRSTATKKARQRVFSLSNIRVGVLSTSSPYTVQNGLTEVFTQLGASTAGVAASTAVMTPYDIDGSLAQAADDICSLVNWYWRIDANASTRAKDGKAAAYGAKQWDVTDTHTPIILLPHPGRANKVRYNYDFANGVVLWEEVTASPNPFPAGFFITYDLELDNPGPQPLQAAFAQQVANYLAQDRKSGSSLLYTVEDAAAPGVAVRSAKIKPGDALRLTNYANTIVYVDEISHSEDGALAEIKFSDSDMLIDKLIARRKRMLAMGYNGAQATLAAMDVEEPAVPTGLTLGFFQAHVRDGHRRFHGFANWTAVTDSILGEGTAIGQYEVRIRPTDAGGTPVPGNQGGGWITHHTQMDKDGDATDDTPTEGLFRNLENPHKWFYVAQVRAVDIIHQESQWSAATAPQKPTMAAMPQLTHIDMDVDPFRMVVSWEYQDDPDSANNILPEVNHVEVQISDTTTFMQTGPNVQVNSASIFNSVGITAATIVSGQLAEITTASAHGMNRDDPVRISGVTPSGYNGTWSIESTPSSTKIRVRLNSSPANGSAFGTAFGTIATYVTNAVHGLNIGDSVKVTGIKPEAYNGTWKVTAVPTTTSFRADIRDSPANTTNNGTMIEQIVTPLRQDRAVKGEHKIFKFQKPLRDSPYFARVRTIDVYGNVSPWLPDPQGHIARRLSAPNAPANVLLTYPTTEKGRNQKFEAKVQFDELSAWKDFIKDYQVELQGSADGSTWTADPRMLKTEGKRDDDAGGTNFVMFVRIHRNRYYRARVRGVDILGNKGDWSSWTAGGLPNDNTSPAAPVNVETWDSSTDRVQIKWDDPVADTETRGTSAVTNGSVNVAGAGTKYTTEVREGTLVRFEGAATQYTVKSVTSDTALVLTAAFSDTTNAARKLYLQDDDPDVMYYEWQIARQAQVTAGTPDVYNTIYDKGRIRGNHVSIKVQDSDKANRFYARVRSVDAALNRSAWVAAWVRTAHAGLANNSTTATGDNSAITTPTATDGTPPASSPTLASKVAGYVGYIAAWWTPVANADEVTYDVHISTTTGFTPSAATLVGSTPGNSANITRYNDGTALIAGTNYYLKIVARDADGSAAAGTQGGPVTTKAQISDGVAPTGTSPTPFLAPSGDFIKANWLEMSNADPIDYEIHVSTTTGFTPSATTLFAVVNDTTTVIITRLPPMTTGGVTLVPGTTYYVKIVARDFDGPATASAQSSAVAPGQISDGLAPQASPAAAVVGGVGFLNVTWTPLLFGPRDATHNPDPVTYEIHASTTTGFTPSAGTKVGEVQGSGFFVRKTATGAVLAYATTYYIKIIAKDVDGSAAAGTQASSILVAATTSDIAANAIQATNIAAGAVNADKLAANLAVAGKLIAALDPLNWQDINRVEIDGGNGLRLIQDDGTQEITIVQLPLDGTPATFKGGVDADSLMASGPVTFKDAGNIMQPASILTMGGGIGPPNGAPSVVSNWPTLRLSTYGLGQHRGLSYAANGGVGGATPCFYGWYHDDAADMWNVGEWNATTGVLLRDIINELVISGQPDFTPYAAVRGTGTTMYMLYTYNGGALTFIDGIWDTNGGATGSGAIDVSAQVNNRRPGLFWDGTNVVLTTTATAGPSSRLRLRKYSVAPLAFSSNLDLDATVTGDASKTRTGCGVLATNSGQTAYYVPMEVSNAAPNSVIPFLAAGTEIANGRFTDGSADAPDSITYNPSDGFLYSLPLNSTGEYHRHSNTFAFTSTVNKVWWGYAWRDSNATGGVHETAISPRTGATWARRSYTTVTWPTPPVDLGGTDDVNQTRLYAVQSAANPGGLTPSYFLQGSFTNPTIASTLTALSTATAGTTPAAFPNVSNSGRIVSASSRFVVAGDDTLKEPKLLTQARRDGDLNLAVGTYLIWTPAQSDYEYLAGQVASGDLWDVAGVKQAVTRFVVPTGWGGLWKMTAQFCFAAGADNSGRTEMMLRKNAAAAVGGGTQLRVSSAGGKDAKVTQYLVWQGVLVAGDYVELFAASFVTDRDLTGSTTQPQQNFALWEFVGD